MPVKETWGILVRGDSPLAESFKEVSDQRILYRDFDKALDEKVKARIETLLNEIVRTIKNREDRRNRYLLPLKCLFCYAEKIV